MKRGGGIVSLAPVVEVLSKVQAGVDKTASELAIVRLQGEIPPIEAKVNALQKNKVPSEYHELPGIGHYGVYKESFAEATRFAAEWFHRYLDHK